MKVKKFEIIICDECPCNQSDEGCNSCAIHLEEIHYQPIKFERLADDECHYLPDGFTCQLSEIKYKNGKIFKPQVLKYSVEMRGKNEQNNNR
jgi:hypothetical protein